MTHNQLKNAVIRLGFETGLDDDGALAPALSRAMYTVYLDRPVRRTVRISVPKSNATLIISEFTHTPGEDERFILSGCAYSFRVSGKGRYTLRKGAVEFTEEFDSDMTEIKGMNSPKDEITFSGEYAYAVYSLASHSALNGPDKSDIPIYGESHKIDLVSRYGDFLAPDSEPRDSRGAPIEGSAIKDGVLSLPYDFSGELTLTYRRCPVVPSGDDKDEKIDIPSETEELLPLLVASYLWLDDDPEKAQYYLSLYKDGISTLRRFSPMHMDHAYVTNGWA